MTKLKVQLGQDWARSLASLSLLSSQLPSMLGTFPPAARLGSLSSPSTRLSTRRLAASLSYAARLRERYPFVPPNTSVDHLVIGGGVIGLSVAAGLVNTAGRDRITFVVERRRQVGSKSVLLIGI